MLRLGRRQSTRLSCTGGCLGGEDVLFEEVLADKFFQVPLEALTMGGPVSFTVIIRAILFCSGECGVVLDQPRTPHPGWSLMALKTSLMGSLSGVRCSILKFWGGPGKDRECLSIVSWLLLILVTNMGGALCRDFDFSPLLLSLREWLT